MLLSRRTLIVSATALICAPYIARANTPFVVEMLNRHPEDPRQRQIFLPRLAVIDPGDTVLFMATDRGHNTASVKGMIPEGAAAWDGALGEDVEITFEVPGIYGHVCTPHVGTGMVGAVVVTGEGVLANYEAAKSVKQRGKASKVFAEIWDEIDQLGLPA
ncbi:MAG: pseudoazurin [Pseudomonadota bacterium]